MTGTFPFAIFLRIHKVLVLNMILFDFILGITGSIFLLAPLDIFALSLDNLSILVLFIFLAVIYQIHIFRTYAGGITFYLNLPVKKQYFLIILFTDTIIPLTFSLIITIIVFAFSRLSQLPIVNTGIINRIFDIILIFLILKTIALPIFILYKRNFIFIVLFLFSLCFIYGLISIAAELMHIHNAICGLLFFATVEALCIRILSLAKIA